MNDLFGQALYDYYKGRQIAPLLLHTSFSTPDELDLEVFFFNDDQFTSLEKYALEQCKGKVLDIGAAAGRHSKYLQVKGIDVTGLDTSPNCVKLMREIGIHKVLHQNIFDLKDSRYDTLLMLMNGIGLVRNLEGLASFLKRMKDHLNKGGQIIMDSSDVSYLKEEYNYISEGYIGEVAYCYEYMGMESPWFKWLYVDMKTLTKIAAKEGWCTQIIYENQFDEYLARLTVK